MALPRPGLIADVRPQDMFGIFASSKYINGKIAYSNMPKHLGYSVSVHLFPVASIESPAPFGGDPDGSQYNDPSYTTVKDPNPASDEVIADTFELQFSIKTKVQFGYLAVSSILFRKNGDSLFAQIERRMYNKRPLSTMNPMNGLILPMQWPDIEIKDLHSYGVVNPSGA